jgi:superfamily II DNA or RNA helicase
MSAGGSWLILMKLYDFQKLGYETLLGILSSKKVALEASGVGYGKTVVACLVAKKLGLPVAVVCPKTIIPDWERTIEACGIKSVFVTNPEMLKSKKFNHGQWVIKNRKYQWKLPAKTLLIWDEVHRCKNWKTQNSKILVATDRYDFRVLMMSATIATSPLDMYAVGMVLGLHDGSSDWFHWLHRHGVRKGVFGFEFKGGSSSLKKLNTAIFPALGHRELPSEIPGFPDNQISVMPIETGKTREIQVALDELALLRKDDAPLPIVDQLRARQVVELMKVPSLAELTEDYVQAGNSVVVFLNFKESINQLAVKLNTPCLLTGDQTEDERRWNIDLFQSNSEKVILCQIQCGGVGVSLHDVNGRPRVSLVSPSYSAVDLVQALGRINRAGALTPAIQKILVSAGTVEENIRKKLEKKINNLNAILDSDLDFFS